MALTPQADAVLLSRALDTLTMRVGPRRKGWDHEVCSRGGGGGKCLCVSVLKHVCVCVHVSERAPRVYVWVCDCM